MARRLHWGLALVALLFATGAQAQFRAFVTTGGFEEVKEDVVQAIQSKGLVIDYTSHIGNMLERTGKDVGSTRPIYGKAEALLFCSAVVSRKMMEQSPRNIGYCPYVIALYTLPGEPGKVHVLYRNGPPEVNELVRGIVKEALNVK